MADGTKIEWTDATWNPITGCAVVSPGCTNCYAMKLAGTRLKNHPSRKGLTKDTKGGPVWTGEVRFNREWLDQPLRWTKPRMIFVCAHGDLFAEGVPEEWIDEVFAVMALSAQHTFQVLTKRPERMRDYAREMERCLEDDVAEFQRRWGNAAAEVSGSPCAAGAIEDREWPLPNVWFGVSVEDRKRAEERIPILLETPAAIRWISAEPLLGDIDGKRWLPTRRKAFRPGGEPFLAPHFYMTKCEHCHWTGSSELFDEISYGDDADVACPSCHRIILADELRTIDWVVAGGESGPGARPMHPDWARALRDQCAAAGVPFLFKQWGNWREACSDWRDYEGNHIEIMPDTDEGEALFDDATDRLISADGRLFTPDTLPPDTPARLIERITKKAAGRLLDGIEHNGFPEVRR